MPTGKVHFKVRLRPNFAGGIPSPQVESDLDTSASEDKPAPQLDFTVQKNSGYLLVAGLG